MSGHRRGLVSFSSETSNFGVRTHMVEELGTEAELLALAPLEVPADF
jgi:hypothetical protein